MKKTNDIVNVLKRILSNETFISSIIQDMDKFVWEEIETKLGTVLSYYIATRDSCTSYTYEEIESKYSEIKPKRLNPDTQFYRNIIKEGVLTHSFNGYKKDRVMKYGLNYMENIKDEKTKMEIQEARSKLERLESMLGQSSPYTNQVKIGTKTYKHTSDEVFFTSPGTKTIEYTCKNSPERLYLGILKQNRGEAEPIVVGETKQTYMLRVLQSKIQRKYPDKTSAEYIEALQLAREITEYYCSKRPAFALIDINQAKNIPISTIVYRADKLFTLGDWINLQINPPDTPNGPGWSNIDCVGDFFSKEFGTATEKNNLGDIATISRNIPNEAVKGIIDMPDEFEIKQMFARAKGIKDGDLIDYHTCEYREKTLTLEDVFEEFRQNNLMSELLEKDTIIEQDDLQYKSDTHGVKHTRRVNFFAMAIMNMENITDQRDRDIIFEIVKNHDIGRVHDWEDKEHGECSVEKMDANEGRLEGFSEEEQELIKFVMIQHSRSAKENEEAIFELPEELKQRYSKMLNIFKDADKLDRVRLDLRGENPNQGLDVSRLSLESSKMLENVAYEANYKLLEALSGEKQKKLFLDSIVGESKKKFGLNYINKFLTTVKTTIMNFLHPNKNEQQNRR